MIFTGYGHCFEFPSVLWHPDTLGWMTGRASDCRNACARFFSGTGGERELR